MATRADNQPQRDPEICDRGDAQIARALTLLGQRWTAVILGNLDSGPLAFSQLARAVGRISDSMLSTRLSALSDAGLVTRTIEEGPPVKVVYDLTDAGRELMPLLDRIGVWAQKHMPEPRQDE